MAFHSFTYHSFVAVVAVVVAAAAAAVTVVAIIIVVVAAIFHFSFERYIACTSHCFSVRNERATRWMNGMARAA